MSPKPPPYRTGRFPRLPCAAGALCVPPGPGAVVHEGHAQRPTLWVQQAGHRPARRHQGALWPPAAGPAAAGGTAHGVGWREVWVAGGRSQNQNSKQNKWSRKKFWLGCGTLWSKTFGSAAVKRPSHGAAKKNRHMKIGRAAASCSSAKTFLLGWVCHRLRLAWSDPPPPQGSPLPFSFRDQPPQSFGLWVGRCLRLLRHSD